MYRLGFIGLLFAVVVSAPAAAAGLRFLTVPADTSGPEIMVSVWYPSPDTPAPVSLAHPDAGGAGGKFDGPLTAKACRSSSSRMGRAGRSSCFTTRPSAWPTRDLLWRP